LNNLVSFPWIKSRVETRQLELLGAYFDVATGGLELYDPDQGKFMPLNAEVSAA
jgi:carbonic anhydrase